MMTLFSININDLYMNRLYILLFKVSMLAQFILCKGLT